MSDIRRIKNALISVFYKDGLDAIALQLQEQGVNIYSTGGTQKHLENLGINIHRVEDLTSYPSILGGRVKTLHPKVFGGILSRRGLEEDQKHLEEYEIPEFDLVIVDLYPFEETLASGGTESEIIEKIDIGGISLIRAAAKNFKDVLTISSREQYGEVLELLKEKKGETNQADRKALARKSFDISSHYYSKIFDYFNAEGETESLKLSERQANSLRYGENPHQKGIFYGNLQAMFEKLHGKELSYNNLLDVDAAVNLIAEFKNDDPTFAILKHNNACGIATRKSISSAYEAALAGDPVSAFGGVLISNTTIDSATAEKIHSLFCEVVIAPSYEPEALKILQGKKNRIILRKNEVEMPSKTVRTALNGYLVQDKDLATETKADFKTATNLEPTEEEKNDLVFAAKLVKNTKSNAIVFVKDNQLLASGTGQTSRVDALQQAIVKAKHFGFDLNGAVMASDAFFPFPDCVELAKNVGITAVVQPGGSIKDQLSIDYCNANDLKMVFTGVRHFKH
ncbi:MAG: bifunctional phosphoribosylaminoimidazolecarboxamide formyltransferase/IMP cyclohydrolase [Flavobacteriales bacterium]|nr:bifunctional phosphoribosylaminoimidazolecarboxamide formyltransferase/IMP cyclohydrolase [Flavobacteriales bacterium]